MAPFGPDKYKWWKEQIIYQVYPASFQDSNGDGWGDIKGITSRLDYLKELGVDTLWSSPFLKSPQVDMGYDISDYKDIDPSYGTLDDVDDLIAELKKRDMRILIDLVVNHTSDQHPWFQESKSSSTNSKRDWYIWKKPKSIAEDGTPHPPNNWSQILGEASSAWNYDEKTGEYYLGLFTPEQPDLDWENPRVRQAVYDVMHFWLKRGSSGFRMDVINLISKVQTFPDAERTLGDDHEFHPGNRFFVNGPRFHEYMKEMNREVLSKYDCYTVGESPGVSDLDEILSCVGANAGELSTQFIFDLVDMDFVPGEVRMTLHPWDVKKMKSIISKYQCAMIERDGWNSIFIENHDNPRSVSRFTDDSDKFRDKGAKLLALMQTTLSGTLFLYQGEEIGIRNIPKEWDVDEYKDVETINFWRKSQAKYGNDANKMAEAREILEKKARDHSRTPMQWTGENPNAGFCEKHVRPWMRLMDDYPTTNAETQMKADDANELSVWQFWQRGLKARKDNKRVFVYGDYEELDPEDENILAYLRTADNGDQFVVVLNFSGKNRKWTVPRSVSVRSWPASNYAKANPDKPLQGTIQLEPWEGLLGVCENHVY